MPSPDYQPELRAAIEAARDAGAFIRFHAGRAQNIREKSRHDLVTAADEEAQRIILNHLNERFPDYDVLAEEGDAARFDPSVPPERPRWIIDPIDGTTNFTHGLPPYCVSIALQAADGELVVGVVYEVALDELFAAAKGQGLTLNGRPAGVSDTEDLGGALVTTGFPFKELWYVDDFLATFKRFIQETRGVRRPGSAAADLAYVACGRFDVFFEAGLEPWDMAAGIVLVREGGGRVTGLIETVDPLFSRQLTATNGHIHEATLEFTRVYGEVFHAGRSAEAK